jgi:hypothetical protein
MMLLQVVGEKLSLIVWRACFSSQNRLSDQTGHEVVTLAHFPGSI